MTALNPEAILAILAKLQVAGPQGHAAQELQACMPALSRATLNRRLASMLSQGLIKQRGAGRAVRYVVPSALSEAQIDQYFVADPQSRPVARYDPALLLAAPSIAPQASHRLTQLMALAAPLDRKFLANFLVDFSWGAAVLEGSSYSDLDTQALLLYGQRNPDKPVEDAVLILNHKQAIEYLWAHQELNIPTLCRLQSMLTDNHDVAGTELSDHFLPMAQRGVVREYEEINLARSAYYPPFRPGTGYVLKALSQIIETASGMAAVDAAFYLMTRIPYVQVFANGNKRTARLVANVPLLQKGLLPLSFVDFDRQRYIRGMAAFYELGNTLILENVFLRGYVKSIIRSSRIPVPLRRQGFDLERVADDLLDFVRTGRRPVDRLASAFIL